VAEEPSENADEAAVGDKRPNTESGETASSTEKPKKAKNSKAAAGSDEAKEEEPQADKAGAN
jgi:hypothetical protein